MNAADEYARRLNDGSTQPAPSDTVIHTEILDAVTVATLPGAVVLALAPWNHTTRKAVKLSPTDARALARALVRAAAGKRRRR